MSSIIVVFTDLLEAAAVILNFVVVKNVCATFPYVNDSGTSVPGPGMERLANNLCSYR